jgi:hypothetical protein
MAIVIPSDHTVWVAKFVFTPRVVFAVGVWPRLTCTKATTKAAVSFSVSFSVSRPWLGLAKFSNFDNLTISGVALQTFWYHGLAAHTQSAKCIFVFIFKEIR